MAALNIFSAENPEGRIDVARAVGSAATTMYIYDLAPGMSACPYHYEYEEERTRADSSDDLHARGSGERGSPGCGLYSARLTLYCADAATSSPARGPRRLTV